MLGWCVDRNITCESPSQDRISNVRLKFCKLLPALKAALKLPADRLLWQQMELSVREMLAGEQQASVAAVVREVSQLDALSGVHFLYVLEFTQYLLNSRSLDSKERKAKLLEKKERKRKQRKK